MVKNDGLRWGQLPPLPDPAGFAGAFAGVSNGTLLLAGGANFPDNIGPWGSTPKTWYSDIYALEEPAGVWRKVGQLSRPLAYGVALTVAGDLSLDGLLCVGGSNGEGHFREVFILKYRKDSVEVKYLSPLPVPLANAAGAVLNGAAYIAGGIESPTDSTAENLFFRLNLTEPNAAWEKLPGWPGPGRMLAVAGAQGGKFFLFSGTELTTDAQGVTTRRYLTDAYAYDLAQTDWQRLADLPHATVAAPSPAYATEKGQLLILGGDDGANAEKNQILKENHPGFRREILAFDSNMDVWIQTGEVFTDKQPDAAHNPTGSVWAPVTTPLVVWRNQIVLPNGEVRPGVRTNRVLNAR